MLLSVAADVIRTEVKYMLALPLTLYAFVGIFFLIQTYVEGFTSKEGGPIHRIVGLLLCLVWPVILLGVTVEVLRAKLGFQSSSNSSPGIAHGERPSNCSKTACSHSS